MADETDFTALPLEERITHKVWKARASAYEELAKKLQTACDEDTLAEWRPYVAKAVADPNVPAQQQGLDFALVWVDNAPKRLVPTEDIAKAIAAKGLTSPKTQTKEKVRDLCLLVIEVGENADPVVETLAESFSARQPKVVANAASLVASCLAAFGAKIVNPKLFLKKTVGVLSHSNKMAREEGKTLVNEIHRWLGDAIKPSLSDVKSVLMKELEDEWSKEEGGKPKPTHRLRSAAKKAAAAAAATDNEGDGAAERGPGADSGDVEEDEEEQEEVDPYDLADPVNGLAKIPKSFTSDLQESKWSIRRDALQAALSAVTTVKLADGDYGDFIRQLQRVVANDSNVINVGLATDCIGAVASGLRDRFAPYSPLVFETLLDKFKEKKLNVVNALHKAVPPVLEQMPGEKAVDALVASLKQKNPLQKQHTAKVLASGLSRVSKKPLPKSQLSSLAPALVACLTAREPGVREEASTALSSLIAHTGEKPVRPFLADVDKKKADKIIAAAASSPSNAGPAPATGTVAKKTKTGAAKKASSSSSSSVSSTSTNSKGAKSSGASASAAPSSRPKTSKRSSASAGASRPRKSRAAGRGTGPRKSTAASKAKSGNKVSDSIDPVTFPETTPDAAEAAVKELVSSEHYDLMQSKAWKEKLEGAKALLAAVQAQDSMDASTVMAVFTYVQTTTRKWKETNFQVMGAYIDVLNAAADKATPKCPDRAVDMAVPPLVDRLADVKLRSAANDALVTLCEHHGPNFVVLRMCGHAKSHRSPKVHAETCSVIANILNAFGMQLSAKAVVAFARTMLASTNAGVRTATIDMLGTLRVFVGPSLSSLFQDEKPALLQLINEKFDKVSGEKAPAPSRFVRGTKASAADRGNDNDDDGDDNGGEGESGDEEEKGNGDDDEDDDDEDEDEDAAEDDLLPRENLMDHVPSDVVTNLGDKSWKVRNEALQQLEDILKRHPRLNPDLGDALRALKERLSDSNKNLVIKTLHHLTTLGEATGRKGCRQNLSHILADALQNLADNKDAVRTAVVDMLTTWRKHAGVAPFVEGEAVPGCLASGKPNAQAGVMNWLSEQFAAIKNPKKLPPLKPIVKPTVQCLQDRNPTVRKAAQALVPHLARSIGADRMRKLAGTLPSASKDVVIGILDKMPVDACAAPAPTTAPSKKGKKASARSSTSAGASSGSKKADAPSGSKPGKTKRSSSKTSVNKGAEKKGAAAAGAGAGAGASSTHPLGSDTKKPQRIRDDKAHKSLKWNFTTPREEYVQQLQNQFKPVVSRDLLCQLFSDDFKDHCKAIDTLHKAVSKRNGTAAPQAEEAVASLDLILMWITLRFFETNPRTQLKAMTFLKNLFDTVNDQEYTLTEYEAAAFIPYLIQKLGDKMENIREDTHAVIRALPQVYSGSRLFSYLLDGLKSKNARQRTGCLLAMNRMLSASGMAVCEQVGAPKALKTVTKQVADRDHTVRSAALDVIVTAHNIQGDGIYKLMGTVPDKNMSLITERVKRNGKSRTGSSANTSTAPGATSAKVSDSSASRPKSGRGAAVNATRVEGKAQDPSVAQEFSLDLDSLNLPKTTEMKMPELAPTQADDDTPATYQATNTTQHQQPAQPTANTSMQQQSFAASAQQSQLPVITPAATLPQQPAVTLEDIIDHISSTDMRQAVHALKMAEDLVKDKDINMLSSVGYLVTACTLQLRLVFTVHAVSDQEPLSPGKRPEAVRLCKHVLSCIMHVYEGRAFARSVPDHVQQQLLVELVSRLLDDKIEKWHDGPNISRALNMILLRILENSRRDVTFAVLIRVLNDACAEKMVVPHRFTELIMKCLWKLTKTLSEHLSEINVAQLLREIHEFLVAHPPMEWKKRSNDMPLRTMKTILNSLVKAMGSAVMPHLSLIGQSPLDTAVGSYVLLMLRRDGYTEEELRALLPNDASLAPMPTHNPQTASSTAALSAAVGGPGAATTSGHATSAHTPQVSVEGAPAAGDEGGEVGAAHDPSSSSSSSLSRTSASAPSAPKNLSERLARAKSKIATHGASGSGAATTVSGEAVAGGSVSNLPARAGLRAEDPGLRHRFDSVAEFVAMEAKTQQRADTGSSAGQQRQHQHHHQQQQQQEGMSDAEIKAAIHDILGRVTSKDTTRQGLRELKEFKQQHPGVDIMAHCTHLSGYMQSYIKRRMEEVDVTSGLVSSGTAAPAGNAVSYLERLRALQSQVASNDGNTSLDVTNSLSTSIPPAPVEQDVNLPEVCPVDTRIPLQRKDNEQQSGGQHKSLASLKARLAKLKQGQS